MYRYLIVIVILASGLAACSHTGEQKQVKPAARTHYKLAKAERGGVATLIKLPGLLSAYNEVSIFPRINGYVKVVKADIGTHVSAGAILMQLDAPELAQAVMQARERYARSRADLAVDKERLIRLQQAALTEGAVSAMDLSSIKAKLVADSALCNAEKANWEMQQAMMDYTIVRAPFAGVVTERNVSPGALVSSAIKDKPMLELKDMAHLRLQVDVPENLASALKVGDRLSFTPGTQGGQVMYGNIIRKAGSIAGKYRTERIEVDVDNKAGKLSAGSYADVLIHSAGNTQAVYVPLSAVVTSTERKYVLAVRDGRAVKIDVTTGNKDVSKIEIFGALEAGEQVIIDANDEIEEGVVK